MCHRGHANPFCSLSFFAFRPWGCLGPACARAHRRRFTHGCQVGLARYDDLLRRMPRAEASAIGSTVAEAAEALLPGAEVIICGSFRRGKVRVRRNWSGVDFNCRRMY